MLSTNEFVKRICLYRQPLKQKTEKTSIPPQLNIRRAFIKDIHGINNFLQGMFYPEEINSGGDLLPTLNLYMSDAE